MKSYLVIIVMITGTLAFCKKDDCSEQKMTLKHLESDYGCLNTKDNLEIDLLDNILFVRTDEDYNTKVTGLCHPQVDFSQYDLIIGKQPLENINDTILYNYVRTCPGTVLSLTIDIVQSSSSALDTIVYHALIPKLSDTETLSVNITIR